MEKMRANVFRGKGEIRVEEVERPRAGLGDHRVVTTLCPGGKERMRRLRGSCGAGAST